MRELEAADIVARVIDPPAYFCDMAEVLGMARGGRVPLLRPDARINPIHGADLAAFTVDRLEGDGAGRWAVGGPDVLTWAEVARMVFAAVGRRPRTTRVPARMVAPVLRAISPFAPRLADTLRFTTWNMLHDCVAPSTGTRRLAEFYAEHAAD